MQIGKVLGIKMNNNDILVRLRYALDIKDAEMVEIFGLGGIEITKEEVQKLLLKSKNRSNNESEDDELLFDEYMKKLDNHTLESFLNGFIIYKRGPQD